MLFFVTVLVIFLYLLGLLLLLSYSTHPNGAKDGAVVLVDVRVLLFIYPLRLCVMLMAFFVFIVKWCKPTNK